jgi:hypothetical protein
MPKKYFNFDVSKLTKENVSLDMFFTSIENIVGDINKIISREKIGHYKINWVKINPNQEGQEGKLLFQLEAEEK